MGLGTISQWIVYASLEPNSPPVREGDFYDPKLTNLASLEELGGFIDSIANAHSIHNSFEYVELVDSIISLRFYHGLQNLRYSDNFMAFLMAQFSWSHFKAKVIPNDILKNNYAFCSQSSIVFQELLKRKNISSRSVLLPGHFCTEVYVNDQWLFYDVNMKPNFMDNPRMSARELLKNREILKAAYSSSINPDFEQLERIFAPDKVGYGEVNAFAAPNMRLFQQITWFFSWFGWAFFLIVWFIIKKIPFSFRFGLFIKSERFL